MDSDIISTLLHTIYEQRMSPIRPYESSIITRDFIRDRSREPNSAEHSPIKKIATALTSTSAKLSIGTWYLVRASQSSKVTHRARLEHQHVSRLRSIHVFWYLQTEGGRAVVCHLARRDISSEGKR